MTAKLWTQIIAAIVPALITGIVSYFATLTKCKNEIKTLSDSNKHEIDKLMKQHEIDIESIKEKHKLELEILEKQHELKLEEMKFQSEQEIAKKEKEISDTAMYSMMGDASKNLFSGIMSSPEVKEQINKALKESFNKKK
jgi:uncharacterized membrane protein YqiK